MSYLAKAKGVLSLSSLTSPLPKGLESQSDTHLAPLWKADQRGAGREISEESEVTSYCCRWCGRDIDWRAGMGLTFADGAVAHVACDDAREVERLLAVGRRAAESTDALSDPAKVMLRGEMI
jgi:hypothetical protein